ncbi:MAG: NAD(+) synthase, partial [Nitrospinae bacterium]|nr:NAD(+) synthase [Nitrospinota bacterium]
HRSSEIEDIFSALVLGTRDYISKNGFSKVVLGLSGGIDSALTAVIAATALGPNNVVGVLMPSPYSSEGSVQDSLKLATNLGIETLTLPIEKAMKAYDQILEEVFEGTHSGLAEENIQARIRGNLLMALSNKKGWIVLATGNKSEFSVGYCTLYGDMAGGFAVIKDVPKIWVYKISRWINGEKEIIPESIITKEPSAELRPNQKDTDSLPPYELLDPILLKYIEEDKSEGEIKVSGLSRATIQKVAKLVDASEYKRRQGPPGVKITPKAFGKDRRLPITTGRRGK